MPSASGQVHALEPIGDVVGVGEAPALRHHHAVAAVGGTVGIHHCPGERAQRAGGIARWVNEGPGAAEGRQVRERQRQRCGVAEHRQALPALGRTGGQTAQANRHVVGPVR